MPELNDMLVKKVNADKAYQKEQLALKKKHKIKNKNVVVVEKSNNLKFIINTMRGVIITILLAAIAILLFVAVTALCYPEPRHGLQTLYIKGVEELRTYLPNMENILNKVIDFLQVSLS